MEEHHRPYWEERQNPRAGAVLPSHGFWASGVATDPRHTFPLPLTHDLVFWTVKPGSGRLKGPAYGDGSGLHGRSLLTRRCGWGLCTVDEYGSLTAAVHGAYPSPVQEVPDAELYALLFYLQNVERATDSDIVFHADCKWVVDTWRAPRATSTQGSAVHADLWRKVHMQAEAIGYGRISVLKVKAHARPQEGAELIEIRHWRGNAAADLAAKAGAALHPVDEALLLEAKAITTTAKEVARFLGSAWAWAFANKGNAHEARDTGATVPEPLPGDALHVVHPKMGMAHQMILDADASRVRCIACWSSAGEELRFSFAAEQCRRPRGTGHNVFLCGAIVFCARCGAYSETKVVHLQDTCRGMPASGSAAFRLRRLLRGKHPVKGQDVGPMKPLRTASSAVLGFQAVA